MGRIGRWLVRVVFVLALTLVLGAAGLILWLRTSVPKLEGNTIVAALSAPVTVARDSFGIPRISAESWDDAYKAMGFVHAQDRLFQMEMMRRIGRGRLAEVGGSALVSLDRRMRSFGLAPLVEEEATSLEPPIRRAFEAYASGVNSYLTERNGALPPEFLALPDEMEPWTVEDSLLWLKLMGLLLTVDWQSELDRAALLRTLTPEQIAELYPQVVGAVTLAELPSKAAIQRAQRTAEIVQEGAGSNLWLIAGRLTASGRPILANDPHLSFSIPNTWYLLRVDTPDGLIAGASAPGFPLMVLGHNGHIAWAFTNGYSDTSDVFMERLAPDDPERYLTPEGSRPFDVRDETIQVRFADPVRVRLRSTRHGPVISDGDENGGWNSREPLVEEETVLALAHTALRASAGTVTALYQARDARSAPELLQALGNVGAPQQNIAFADTQGQTGFYAPALVPIRAEPPGALPVPGWTGEHDWIGYIPYDRLPKKMDPRKGRLINANNRPVSLDYPYALGSAFTPPMRAEAIAAALAGRTPHTLEGSVLVQLNDRSLAALQLLALVDWSTFDLRVASGLLPDDLLDAMRNWNGYLLRNRPEPLFFYAWLHALVRALYEDELGEHFGTVNEGRIERVMHTLQNAPDWCDDVNTSRREDCAAIVATAFSEAYSFLSDRFGADWHKWRWGDMHQARFSHRPIGMVPVLGSLFNRSVPHGGGRYSPNAGVVSFRESSLFNQVHGATFRAVYDLSDLERSRFIQAVGQSGNIFSPHYDDLLPLWAEGKTVELRPLYVDDTTERSVRVLRLLPPEMPDQ